MGTPAQGPWVKYQAEQGPWTKYTKAAFAITAENLQDTIVRRSQGQLSPEESEELNRFIGDPANREAVKAATTAMSSEGRQGPVARFLNAAVVDPAVGTAQLLRQNASMGVVNPFGVARDVGAGLIGAQQEAGQEFFEKAGSETNPLRNVERFLEAGVPVAGPIYRSLRKKVEAGDLAGAAGETALQLIGARLGTKPPRLGTSTTAAVTRRVLEVGRKPQVAQSVVKEAMSLPPRAVSGVEDIFRASAPTGTKVGFRQNAYVAAGDLAEIGGTLDLKSARGGMRNPDLRPRATVNAVNEHLSKMYREERLPQISRHADNPMPVQLTEEATEGLRYIEETAGQAADRALSQQAGQAGTVRLADLDSLARVVNRELLPFERMTAAERATAGMTNRRLAGLKALDRELGKLINDELMRMGEVGLALYERRFAALSQIRDQLQSRMNAIELQRSNVAGRVIRATLGGKAGIASASQASVADVNIGRLLEKGFQNLVESGVRPNRGTPPSVVPRLALPPARSIQSPERMPPPPSTPVSEIPPRVDVSAATTQPWPKMLSVNEVRAEAAKLRQSARKIQERAAAARDPRARTLYDERAQRNLARARQLDETANERSQAIERANAASEPVAQAREQLSTQEMSVFKTLPARFGGAGKLADEIIAESGVPAAQLNPLLTDLEMRGIISKRPGGRYVANRAPDSVIEVKPKVPAKEPWQMTYQEWADFASKGTGRGTEIGMYKAMLSAAVREGKPVPRAIVERYDLAPRTAGTEAAREQRLQQVLAEERQVPVEQVRTAREQANFEQQVALGETAPRAAGRQTGKAPTYDALSAEQRSIVDQMVKAYKESDFFGKKNFEDGYNLKRGSWLGMLLQEKFARAMQAKGEI